MSPAEITGGASLRIAPSIVVALDTEGRVISLNQAAAELLSTTVTDAPGKTYVEVLGASLADRVMPLYLRVARSRVAATSFEVVATLPASGRRAKLRATAGPVLEADGSFGGILIAADEVREDVPGDVAIQTRRAALMREAVRRYAGDAVAAALDARPSFIDVGGRRRTISALHADVRGYTTVAEALEPEDLTEMLLRYHGAAVQALLKNGATMDRFIGDSVVAIWNGPQDQQEHARMAIAAALDLQRATREVGSELQYGAGINSGPAIVGNLGSDQFMNFTAVGDTVNVAARLQSAAGTGEIVCSRATLDAAGPGVRTTPLGSISVKGRKSQVEAYRLDGLDA